MLSSAHLGPLLWEGDRFRGSGGGTIRVERGVLFGGLLSSLPPPRAPVSIEKIAHQMSWTGILGTFVCV